MKARSYEQDKEQTKVKIMRKNIMFGDQLEAQGNC